MKFLIAGFGSIGRRHLRNLLALGEQDVLLYRTRQSTLPEDEIASIAVETDLGTALDRRPDAVIVANPTALHLETALAAARAGCHVLIEKPVSHSLEGIGELQASLEENHARALVGFQFRFHPGLRQVAAWMREGAIGRPLSARAQWGEYLPNWHPWEDYRRSYSARGDLGGGVVLTLSHPLDYLRWLLGEVDGVAAMTGKLSDLELTVEDTAEIGLHFATGCLGSLHLDYNQQPPTHTLEIIGTQGTLRWDAADGAARLYRAASQAWEICPPPEGFERNTLFLDELRHFREVIRGTAEPVCTLADGERALRLALAVHEAAQSGRMVQL